MKRIQQTAVFRKWLARLRDRRAAAIVAERIERLRDKDYGDVKSLSGGLFEARVHLGPGYRIYYAQRGAEVIILLVGGDKGSQRRDIERAKAMWKELK